MKYVGGDAFEEKGGAFLFMSQDCVRQISHNRLQREFIIVSTITSPNMSRFFAAGSSSESESSEEESLYSGSDAENRDSQEESSDEESDEVDEDSDSGSSIHGGANAFLKSEDEDSDSDEEEDRSRVAKSAKDKKFEELEGVVRLIENAEKIGDWTVISAGRTGSLSAGLADG